jgi:hypothetical protein
VNTQLSQDDSKIRAISLRRRDRALKAWEMFEGGAKINDLAEYFGISRRMVFFDLKVARQLQKEAVQDIDPGEMLGQEIAYWRKVVRQAMRDYQLAQSENGRIGFLRLATEARAKLVKILQDAGLLTKVPEEISLETKIPFEDPEVRKAYLGFLKLARERGEKNLGV